jgi:hypothetical protein
VLAANVGAGEPQLVAEKVAQQKPRFGYMAVVGAIDVEVDPDGCRHDIPGTSGTRVERGEYPALGCGSKADPELAADPLALLPAR